MGDRRKVGGSKKIGGRGNCDQHIKYMKKIINFLSQKKKRKVLIFALVSETVSGS